MRIDKKTTEPLTLEHMILTSPESGWDGTFEFQNDIYLVVIEGHNGLTLEYSSEGWIPVLNLTTNIITIIYKEALIRPKECTVAVEEFYDV